MIKILPQTESFVYLECDQGMLMEINESFSFRPENYQFMPAFKMGAWDGYIRLINLRNSTAPKGIVPDIIDWCVERGYKFHLHDMIKEAFLLKVDFNFEDLKLSFNPHDYQEEAVDYCLRKKRQIILSSTGSGKSLIIYSIVRALQEAIEEDEKILLIVPNISLVDQMYSDFIDYSVNDDDWHAEDNCHRIMGGKDKNAEQQVYISTWQSIYKLPKSYFEQFTGVLADEVHLFQAKSCTSILDKCENGFFRFGFTGTLDDCATHEMQLKALFGPVHRVSSTKDLMDRNILSTLDIKGLILKHPKASCDMMKGAVYQDEINYIVGNETRNQFITNLAKTRKGNTLVLFQFIEKHGKPLFEMVKEQAKNKQVFLVYGGTDSDQREKVRKIAETRDDVIIMASYAVYSTGVNIVNLENIIFASPTKSKIRVLQSVGRGLRKGENKEHATLYDIADDLRGGRKKQNYTLRHFIERYNTYINEDFSVEIQEIEI